MHYLGHKIMNSHLSRIIFLRSICNSNSSWEKIWQDEKIKYIPRNIIQKLCYFGKIKRRSNEIIANSLLDFRTNVQQNNGGEDKKDGTFKIL